MKTFTRLMKKTAGVTALAIVAVLIFAFGIIRANGQVVITTNTDGTNTLKTNTAVQQPADSGKATTISVNTDGLHNVKASDHAPDPNDPDYATKKAEWVKNYPGEYNAASPGAQVEVTDAGSNTTVKKLGEHAPEFGDPDYKAKFLEWMTNYPDEYNASLGVGNPSGIDTNNATDKLGNHAPGQDDPDYDAKKAEWIKNYPEEYKKAEQVPTDNK